MTRKKWTLLILGDQSEGIRQFTLSLGTVRAVVGGLALLGFALLAISSLLLVNGAAGLRERNLSRENALLSQELALFQERITSLEATIGKIGEQDNRFRLLAGLDTTDMEIMEVGIGGPGMSTPEAHPLWVLDSLAGKTAFAVDYDLNALVRRARFLHESLVEASDSLMAHNDLLESTPSILPAAGVLSSAFSNARLHPIHHRALPHEGVDISAPFGTPILAAAKGTVTYAGWIAGLGNTVEIDHGYGYATRYGHASKLLVRRGDQVKRGQPVAQVGSTGISTSSHLHYEVRVGGRAVNPMNYVIGNIIP